MSRSAIGEQETLRRRAQVLLLGAVSDIVIGVAAFIWGDLVLPAVRVPGIELTLGQLIGALLVFVTAPVHFLLYSRVKSRLERAMPTIRADSGRREQARGH